MKGELDYSYGFAYYLATGWAILRRFVAGMTYDEIAAELKLTPRGIRWNIDQIVEKGGFRNKYEMLTAVLGCKLIVSALTESADE